MSSSPFRLVVWGFAAVVGIFGGPAIAPAADPLSPAADVEIRFTAADVDREAAALKAHVEAGRKTVERFFDAWKARTADRR